MGRPKGPEGEEDGGPSQAESGSEVEPDWIKDTVAEIMQGDSSAAAVVLDHAIESNPEEGLFELAADIALERGETKVASGYIESLSDGPRKDMASSRLARAEGDWEKADELEAYAISRLDSEDRVRAEISSLVRKYDDRVPGTESKIPFETLLSEADSISISDLVARRQGACFPGSGYAKVLAIPGYW